MILGIDTATSTGVIGLYQKEKGIRGELSFQIERGHGRILNPLLDQLFSHLGLKPGDLTGIIVGRGPGSFTGTRVGITLARALALALEIPLWGISTMEALALNCPQGDPVLSLIDARNERVYWGLYSWEGERPVPLIRDGVDKIACLGDKIQAYCANLVVVGEYPEHYLELLARGYSGTISRAPVFNNQLRGGSIAYAGYLYSKEKPEGESPDRIVPFYLKKAT